MGLETSRRREDGAERASHVQIEAAERVFVAHVFSVNNEALLRGLDSLLFVKTPLQLAHRHVAVEPLKHDGLA